MRKIAKIAMLATLFAISLVLGLTMCSATDPEDLPWSNETDVIILPFINDTDIIPLPPPPPDPVIIIVDDDIQEQLYNIYEWMMGHDDIMMGALNMIREINSTLNARIMELIEQNKNTEIVWTLTTNTMQGQIDTYDMDIEELRQEVAQVYQELETQAEIVGRLENTISVLVLILAVAIGIAITALYLSRRKV